MMMDFFYLYGKRRKKLYSLSRTLTYQTSNLQNLQKQNPKSTKPPVYSWKPNHQPTHFLIKS